MRIPRILIQRAESIDTTGDLRGDGRHFRRGEGFENIPQSHPGDPFHVDEERIAFGSSSVDLGHGDLDGTESPVDRLHRLDFLAPYVVEIADLDEETQIFEDRIL